MTSPAAVRVTVPGRVSDACAGTVARASIAAARTAIDLFFPIAMVCSSLVVTPSRPRGRASSRVPPLVACRLSGWQEREHALYQLRSATISRR